MTLLELDVNRWAEDQFAECELGDQRRTRRAVEVAAQFAADPSGSTTRQTETWADCKAAYRLMDQKDVTFRAMAAPHWRHTRAQTSGHFLLLGDTTTVAFGMARERESKIWGEVIDLVGPAPQGVSFTHVFDRGADNFEVYCRLVLNQTGWVVRVAQRKRRVLTPSGERCRLDHDLDSLPVSGTCELSVRANHDQPARTGKVEVRFAQVTVPRPKNCSKLVRRCGITAIAMWVVEVREVNPPPDVQPLQWILFTSQAVECFADAWRVIGYYEKRPLIEEYHKALKTGCRLEARQYRKSRRLQALCGMLSVLAVRLLQLKSVARVEPDRPAEHVVPKQWLHMACCTQRGRHRTISTVQEFYHTVARLGGWLGRKHDGQPGWITLWRGFDKLILMMRGADAPTSKCG